MKTDHVSIRLSIPRSRNQWLLLLLGLIATVGSAVPLARGAYSLTWSKADAVVVAIRDRPGFRVRGVDVVYRYTYGGRTYTGDRYRFQSLLSRDRMYGRDVQHIVARYPPGEHALIGVNPANPADSVFAPGVDGESLIPLVLGLFLLLLGLGDVRKSDRALVSRPPEPRRPSYRLAWILGLTGTGLLLYGAYNLYRGAASAQWPATDGKVLYSHARSGRNPETLLWYEYHVDQRRYVSSNYRNGGNGTPFRDTAQEAAKRYPAGRLVKVYYNPGDPAQALLEPGIWWGNLMAPLFGAVLLGAAWIAKKYAQIRAIQRSQRRFS